MSIEARKIQLIEQVMRFNEKDLDKVERFLSEEAELSASLDRAMKEVERGEVTPHNEIKKKYEKWL